MNQLRLASFVAATILVLPAAPARSASASADTVAWFQKTEQALMDSVAAGDKGPFDRVMDADYAATTEEGEVIARAEFLKELGGLPPGLSGNIAVKELTVQEFPAFAVVRYLADETETVFSEKLATKYRVTDTFRRDGKEWKLLATHTSVVTADPAAQVVDTSAWPKYAGTYRILPDGWTFTVELRDGKLFGGRDPKKMQAMIPLTSSVFVRPGSLGEWMFSTDASGKVTHILDFRKFESLIWTRVEPPAAK